MGLVILAFFVIFAVALLAVSMGMKYLEAQRTQQMEKILRTVDGEEVVIGTEEVIAQGASSREGPLDELLKQFGFFNRLDASIQQSGLEWSLTRFLAMTVLLVVAGALIGTKVRILLLWQLSSAAMACILGCLPYLYIMRKRSTRMKEFESQFPDALDFLARSMRAGHAFSISIGMLAEDAADPLGLEFRKVYNEHNLGAPLDVALNNLLVRVDLIDVRFFVASVLLQREVGGNLGEILGNLAYIIRERFRIRGQVQAASAHGRLTAGILTVMPIVTLLGLLVVAPGYIQTLAEDPDGKWLLVYAVISQLVGYYIIRRIIDIKV